MNETRTSHTPGPWKVVEQDAEGHAVIESADGEACVAYTAGWYRDDGRNDGPANARLIAAAPKLADALAYIAENDALDALGQADDSDVTTIEVTVGWLREVRAALAKAGVES